MKQEDKELLLKDLYARLPYGVKVKFAGYSGREDCTLNAQHLGSTYNIEYLRMKPYLRPLSSITKEEEAEFEELFIGYSISQDRNCVYCSKRGDLNLGFIDWLITHHFDYRGLIPMGLALEAPENMYKVN